MKRKSWYAHGKLLITGEYLVLEGARALALPLKVGQYLSVKQQKESKLYWNSLKPDGIWFQAVFQLPGLIVQQTSDKKLTKKLHSILLHVRSLNPGFLAGNEGYNVETILEFDPEYGFGSSSTLIYNLARWAGVDAFDLQTLSFGGSGYDIACASAKKPIVYQLAGGRRLIKPTRLTFDFTAQLYFVYLGKKQRSAESIRSFRQKSKFSQEDVEELSLLTDNILTCKSISLFEELLKAHETLLSRVLKRKTVQSLLFNDHDGVVKSLGGWGGDFVLMTNHTTHDDFVKYLKSKGFDKWYRYDDLVLR